MKTKKLGQCVAIDPGVKKKVLDGVTDLHKRSQKGELFSGLTRKYQPINDDPTTPLGEKKPDEGKRPAEDALSMVTSACALWSQLFDQSATREWGNCEAKADIVVGGKVLIASAPVTYMLFLEKQLDDIRKFVETLPTLDTAEQWARDANGEWRSQPTQTLSTKKVMKPVVLAPATVEHPAQVKESIEDVTAGTWTAVKISTALQPAFKKALLERVEDLTHAVKSARELANGTDVEARQVAKAFFEYLTTGLPTEGGPARA
jgi:hypothetical protein